MRDGVHAVAADHQRRSPEVKDDNGGLVDPICPIIRFTMLLGYGYYDDCLFINAVNQRIRKTGNEEPSDLGLNLHACVRIESYEPNERDPIHRGIHD